MLRALIERRFGKRPDPILGEPTDPLFQRVLSRGAVRDFLPAPVSDGLFDLLFASALSASSKSDLQQASIIDIHSPGQREEIAKLVPDLDWVLTAPRFLVFCGDAHRVERIAALRGEAVDNGNVEGFLNATLDAALVLQTFILSAEAAGLGCCPVSNLRYRGPELAALLKLPDRVFPVAGLAVGYPRAAPRIKPRFPLSLSVHRDTYTPISSEDIDGYDRVRGLGKGDLTWSAERAKHIDPAKGERFADYLASHGFKFAQRTARPDS